MIKASYYINARFLTQPITGVQRYGIEISRAIKQFAPSVKFVAPRNIIHHEIANELEVDICGHLTGHLWEQTELPIYLRKAGNPIFINLANTAPLDYNNNVIALHDVAFERYSQSFNWKFKAFYKFLIPKLLRKSKAIITVSDFSRSEISELYKIQYNDIYVIHNSVSEIFKPISRATKDKYILAVSSLNLQKNFISLVKAYILLKRDDVKLVIVGGFNSNFTDPLITKFFENNPNILLKGRVSDIELAELYSNALCFVYPSLYEGFGIPPLEAQACGCPVVVSNVASLPEVCGDSAVYCDPYSINDIADKVSMLIDSYTLRESMQLLGFKNINRFSWKNSAEKILDVAREVA